MLGAMDVIERARARLRGRTVVITGASSGIGRATAEALADEGTRMVLLARRRDVLDEVAAVVAERGAEVLVQAVDLRDADAARAAALEAVERWGAPDLVFANAGHSIARSLEGCVARPDTITRSAAANYTGPIHHLLPLLGAMLEQGRGQVVASSTVNARTSVPGWSAYISSKAAFDAWLRSIEPELRAGGVATSILAFPLVATPMTARGHGPRQRGGMSAEDAAGWVARAVVTRRPRITPVWLKPYEVLHAAAPVTVSRITGRFSLRLARD